MKGKIYCFLHCILQAKFGPIACFDGNYLAGLYADYSPRADAQVCVYLAPFAFKNHSAYLNENPAISCWTRLIEYQVKRVFPRCMCYVCFATIMPPQIVQELGNLMTSRVKILLMNKREETNEEQQGVPQLSMSLVFFFSNVLFPHYSSNKFLCSFVETWMNICSYLPPLFISHISTCLLLTQVSLRMEIPCPEVNYFKH